MARRRSINAMAPDPAAIVNAIAARQEPSPTKVMFVARGIDPKMLERAKKMKEERGGYGSRYGSRDRLAEDIWKETGLWEYQPNVWLQEIPDNTMTLNAPLPAKNALAKNDAWSKTERIPGPGTPYYSGRTLAAGPMPEILNRGANNILYELYPELKNIPVEVFDDYIYSNAAIVGGYLQPGTGNVYIGKSRNNLDDYLGRADLTDSDEEIKRARLDTATHELQHVVNMLDRLRAPKPGTPYETRGSEILANVTEARRDLTEEQRREIPPMYDPDQFNFENYRELSPSRAQSPNRWDKQSTQSSPLSYGPYGIPKPRRSVKKPNPDLHRKY